MLRYRKYTSNYLRVSILPLQRERKWSGWNERSRLLLVIKEQKSPDESYLTVGVNEPILI